jgi:hypothetical protein
MYLFIYVRLFLQWNSLGCGRDSFGLLCDGLKINQSLEELDLRNNQIGPSAVKDLATAIRSNKSLKTLGINATKHYNIMRKIYSLILLIVCIMMNSLANKYMKIYLIKKKKQVLQFSIFNIVMSFVSIMYQT